MATTIVREITVDVAQLNRFAAIVAKQYDMQSRFLKVHITNLEQEVRVDSGSTVVINARREDDVSKSFAGTVNDDGTVTVPITSWMLALDGTVLCDISIISGTDKMLTSTMFELDVQQAVTDDTSISHDEDYGILLQLINEVEDVKEEYETSAETIKNTYEESMQAGIDACNAAVAAAQLVTGPFYIVNNDTHKTYTAAIQVTNGKPVMIYDEFIEETED